MWRRTTWLWLCLASTVASSSGCAGSAGTPPRTAAESTLHEPNRLHGRQLVEVADLLAARGDRVRAAQYLHAAKQDGVPAREVVPRLISLYTADAQYRLAIETAENYLASHPRDQRVRKCLGALYSAIGADAPAIRTFEAVLRATPDDAQVHYALASLLKTAGTQRARASEHYRAYLALAPHGDHAEEARAGLLTEVP